MNIALQKSPNLNTLALQFIDCGQGAGWRLEVDKAVTLASVGSLVQYRLCGDDGAEPGQRASALRTQDGVAGRSLLAKVDQVLVRGVGGEAADVEVGPGERVARAAAGEGGGRGAGRAVVAGREGVAGQARQDRRVGGVARPRPGRRQLEGRGGARAARHRHHGLVHEGQAGAAWLPWRLQYTVVQWTGGLLHPAPLHHCLSAAAAPIVLWCIRHTSHITAPLHHTSTLPLILISHL